MQLQDMGQQIDFFNTAIDGKPGYVFYEDAGHAWLKVSRKELDDLHVDTLISCFSYTKGDYVYLEEDADLTTYLRAKGLDTREAVQTWWDANVQTQLSNRSSVRNYEAFKPDMDKLKRQFNMPVTASEVDIHPYTCTLGHSELAIHCQAAGKGVKRLWKHATQPYGWALLHDNQFIHGALTVHSDGNVSLS